jgi:molecular chaperone GrpE
MEPRPSPEPADQPSRPGGGEREASPSEGRSPAADPDTGTGADAPDPNASRAPDQDEASRAVAEMADRWRRAAADLDNFRKRYLRELTSEVARERDQVAAAWLPIVDNLERALAHAGSDPDTILQGVRAVRDQAVELLARLGYPRRADVNVPFDPNRHEVVTVIEDTNAEPGTVVDVLRPGYGDAERQLRPAAVAVSRPGE